MQDKYTVHRERHVIDRRMKQIAVHKPFFDLKD